MYWFKKNPLFFSFLIILFLVFLGQLYFLFQKKGEAAAARAQYESQAASYNNLLNKRPSPIRENEGRVEADLEQVKQRLVGMRNSLSAQADISNLMAGAPANTTEAYFDIISFVNNARELAEAYDIEIAENEMFGFSLYVNQGPEPDLIEDIYRQRRVIEYLIERLFEAGPDSLIGVSREDPASDPEDAADDPYGSFGSFGFGAGPMGPRPSAGGTGGAADRTRVDEIFTIDSNLSARIPNILETHAFRINFEGDTRTLRQFLNDLSQFEMPIVVRSVEVESAGGALGGGGYAREGGARTGGGLQPRATAGGGNPYATRNPYGDSSFGQTGFGQTGFEEEQIQIEPIVEETKSMFTVTVEFIELLPSRVLQNASY